MVPVNKFNNGGKDLYLDNYKISRKKIKKIQKVEAYTLVMDRRD